MTTATPTLFQSLPPIPPPTNPHTSHHRPPLPALSQVTGGRRRKSFPFALEAKMIITPLSRPSIPEVAFRENLSASITCRILKLTSSFLLRLMLSKGSGVRHWTWNWISDQRPYKCWCYRPCNRKRIMHSLSYVLRDPHMADLVRERFAGIDQFKVLQVDFAKCHIHSHMISLLESRKSLAANSSHAKVRT
ncbi:uncharacterized protein LOC110825459 isoform X2 [Carica papaya]|uniref:uncharacterized protein LOC110825459 isoform X2 n=1 Tax=Carica papaya TaxID=3649 RepID=UPI000B8CA360|nr:uncharacterized protein LOC110825459 isoform X2 [Carica papaya]